MHTAAATATRHDAMHRPPGATAAAIEAQWRAIKQQDHLLVRAATAKRSANLRRPTEARPGTRVGGSSSRRPPHEVHAIEVENAWAELRASEARLMAQNKRAGCDAPESPTHRKRNRWAAVMEQTELAFENS